MGKISRILFSVIASLVLVVSAGVGAQAQTARDKSFYPQDVTYDPAIPTPKAFIGHELGYRITRNDLLVQYLLKLAEVSDRVSSEIIAYSHEKRPIVTLTITAPENHDRLEEIRQAHLALRDPESEQQVGPDTPVISWLNYGVHGAEVSSTDAAMPVAYHLAAAQGAEIDRLLKNSVILLTASFNPDGSSRQSAWNWMHGADVPVTDPNARIHNTFWPGGRTNHYWFDLNRQWLLLQHPEPKGWVAKFHEWKPSILADYHEMGSHKTYYFHPGAPDRIFPLIPEKSMQLLNKVVDGPRAFMDNESRLYFNEESYDNFYIGKGSTYPHVNGSIGILFEQARTNGLLETPYGILSFRDNIRTQFRTSLALLKSAADMRQDLLNYQREFVRETRKLAARDDIKAYVFAVPEDPARAYHFLDLLERHQIRTYRLGRDLKVNGKLFRAVNSYVVETGQDQYRLIKGIFEKITTFENNTFYDVSGWTLPLAFGLDYTPVKGRSYTLGQEARAEFPVMPTPEKARSGYVFSWSPYYAPRALYRLLKAGGNARVATKSFKITTGNGVKEMGRGSIVVPVGWQAGQDAERIHELVRTITREDGIPVYALDSSHTPMAGMDLGSPYHAALTKPKVLLLVGEGVSAYDAGEVWHLLDHQMKMPVVLYDRRKLGKLDLSGYTHIIMVGGSYKSLDETITKKVDNWVRSGGTLVALRQGARWAGENLLELETSLVSKDEAEKNAPPARQDYGDKEDLEALEIIGGAIMAGDLDITHPIGYGYVRRDIASHRNTLIAFERPKNPYATVVEIPENALLSGYASAENQRKLAGRAMAVAERLGQGSVVLFSDNPNFRAYFYGTKKLFLNSLFFSKIFEKPKDPS